MISFLRGTSGSCPTDLHARRGEAGRGGPAHADRARTVVSVIRPDGAGRELEQQLETGKLATGSCNSQEALHEGLRRPSSEMSPWSATAAPAKHSWSPRCCSMPARSTASAAWTTARRSPITTKRRSPASTPSPAASPTSNGTSHKINFIDTPGMANFLSDARAALRVVGCARWSSSTRSPASRSRPRRSGRRPRSSRCRGIDRPEPARPRARQPRPIARVAARRCSAARWSRCSCRSARRRAFRGVVDLVAMKAWTFADRRQRQADRRARSRRTSKAPAQAAREALIEMVAEADDALMEKFFDAGTLTQEELVVGLSAASPRRASSRCCARRRRPTSACSRCSTRSSPTCRRRPSGRCKGDASVRRGGAASRPPTADQRRRSSGRPSPIRSPAASRCSASCRAR